MVGCNYTGFCIDLIFNHSSQVFRLRLGHFFIVKSAFMCIWDHCPAAVINHSMQDDHLLFKARTLKKDSSQLSPKLKCPSLSLSFLKCASTCWSAVSICRFVSIAYHNQYVSFWLCVEWKASATIKNPLICSYFWRCFLILSLCSLKCIPHDPILLWQQFWQQSYAKHNIQRMTH